METKKVEKFIFPVGDKKLSQDDYYRALSKASSGFYPLGANGIWHGGIHVDDAVLSQVGRNDNKINCMANGEVVAYRVNEIYPEIIYDQNTKKGAYFSTGFTLVRHYLQMPKLEGEDDQPSITLYSLYMHQLDWFGYQAKKSNKETLSYPNYWSVKSGKVKGNARDPIKGTAIREKGKVNDNKTKILGLLLEGAKITVGEKLEDEFKNSNDLKSDEENKDKVQAGWNKFKRLNSGLVITPKGIKSTEGSDQIGGYVHISDLSGELVTGNSNKGLGEQESQIYGTTVYKEANDKKIAAYLPTKTYVEFSEQKGGYAKITKINRAPSISYKGWVKLEHIDILESEPEELDKVVLLETPVPIDEGDFIGYLGHNNSLNENFSIRQCSLGGKKQRSTDSELKLEGHFEIFTLDDFNDFKEKTKKLAEKSPENKKSLLLFGEGIELVPNAGNDSSGDSKNKIFYPRIIPIDSLEKEEENGKTWAKIEAGNENHDLIEGWVNISKNGDNYEETKIKQISPWEWSDFETQTKLTKMEELAKTILGMRKNSLPLNTLSPLMSMVYNIIVETIRNVTNEEETILSFKAEEFRIGLMTPWLAEKTGRIVVKYESEWYAEDVSEKWKGIKELHKDEIKDRKDGIDKLEKVEKVDKDRLKKCVDDKHQCYVDRCDIEIKDRISPSLWWSDVFKQQGKDGKAWHFHPVGLINLFKTNARRRWAHSPFGIFLGKVESKNSYSAYNKTVYDPSVGKKVVRSVYESNITSMTLNEIMKKQQAKEMLAVGRFQIITETLKDAKNRLRLDGTRKFDEEMQDYIFEEYLIKIKRPAIIKYLESNGDVEEAIYEWAKEFASAGVRKGKKISLGKDKNGKKTVVRFAEKEGVSYYSGDGLNNAHILPNEMVNALIESKYNWR